MARYSIKYMLEGKHDRKHISYQDHVGIVELNKYEIERADRIFAFDAFVIGYVLQGNGITEFNNTPYRLEKGTVFIISPTHICKVIEHSNDYLVRLMLVESSGYNLGLHMKHLINSARWTRVFFNPVLKLTQQERDTMEQAVQRIIEQIQRRCPARDAFIRIALEWHHVELDNIMQTHSMEWSNSTLPVTRQQELAQTIYFLAVNNFKKEHKMKFYSDKLCLSQQYINQIMTKVMGRSLSKILSDMLYTNALSMLHSSDMSIQEIVDELNFPDQASFSKYIKKISGMSPGALRKARYQEPVI